MTKTQVMAEIISGINETQLTVDPSFSRDLLDLMSKIRDAAKEVVLTASPEASFVELLKGPLSALFKTAEHLEDACRMKPDKYSRALTAELMKQRRLTARDTVLDTWTNLIVLDDLLNPSTLNDDDQGRSAWSGWVAYDLTIDDLRRLIVKTMEFSTAYMSCCREVNNLELSTLRDCQVSERKSRTLPTFMQPARQPAMQPAVTKKSPVSLTEPPLGSKKTTPATCPPPLGGPIRRKGTWGRNRRRDDPFGGY
jgi:hypothetical protein